MASPAKLTEHQVTTGYADTSDGDDEHLVQCQTWARWRAVLPDGGFGPWRTSAAAAADDAQPADSGES